MSYERRKVRVGKVVSDKMDKTVVVAVEGRRPHPIYKKAVRKRTRFKVHDEENQCKLGDLVRIIETRPMSSAKRWRVAGILAREEIAEIQPEEITVDEDVVVARPEPPPMQPIVAEEAVAEEPEAVVEVEEAAAVPVAEEPEAVVEVEEAAAVPVAEEPEAVVEVEEVEAAVVAEEPEAVVEVEEAEVEEPGGRSRGCSSSRGA